MTDFLHGFSSTQDILLTHAGEWWTYLATMMLCWIDGFFPPLPSESIVIAMAAMAMHNGPVLWYFLLPVAFIGAMLGDNTAYVIGRLITVERWATSDKAKARVEKGREMLQRKGPELLMTARFIPIYRVFVNMAAGSLRLPWRRFVVIDAISALTWTLFCFAIGSASGKLFGGHSPLLGVIIGVALGMLIGVGIDQVQKKRSRRTKKKNADEPDSSTF